MSRYNWRKEKGFFTLRPRSSPRPWMGEEPNLVGQEEYKY